MTKFVGMRGKEIKVGTLIAMPFAIHSRGYVRVGRVIELIPDKNTGTPKKIRVEWLVTSEYRPPSTSLVEKFGKALVLPDNFEVSGEEGAH